MAAYLQPADYEAYGIAAATDAQVIQASRLIDARIGRPDGLLWSPDANGNPAWMTGRTATRNYTLASATVAGLAAVAVNNASFGRGDVGAAVVIDRANSLAAETCIVTAAGGNTITLNAQFDHAEGATLEYGLTIGEDVSVKYGNLIQTGARPLAAVLSVTGNYLPAWGHRPRFRDRAEEWLAIGTDFDAWDVFPLGQLDIDANTGVALMLPGTVRGGFSRVRINYIAGWNYTNLPAAIKQAVANIVLGYLEFPELTGNIQTLKDGDATITRFRSGSIDVDTMQLLAGYRTLRI